MDDQVEGVKRLSVLVLGTGRGPFMHCLTNLLMTTRQHGIEVQLINVRGSDIISGRTKAVRTALAYDATHTLWLDDDMWFPPHLAIHWLERDISIVASNAVTKDLKFRPLASSGPNEEDRVSSVGKAGLERVTGMGLAAVMVRTDVYRKIEFPWFGHRWHHVEGLERPVIGEPNWEEWAPQFEDSWFFQRCHDAGITVWLDHDISHDVGHYGGVVFFEEGAAAL